ncbi:peroxidase 4 [Fagus crenata]
MATSFFSFLAITALSLSVLFIGSNADQLSATYYASSCPILFRTIKSIVETTISKEARMGASILRLFYHDCFVNGCDGSLLLDDTPNFIGEKTSPANRNSARGFEIIDSIKSAVEEICPGVVSCADILAIASRDAVFILGGPNWTVELGRRDATTASQAAANTSLPSLGLTLDEFINSFNKLGLSTRDLVALLGAHTIGQAKCVTFRDRIYNETSSIEDSFARTRQVDCPRTIGSVDNNLAPLDLQSPTQFNNNYYQNLVQNRGLLHVDQQLFSGGSSDTIVTNYSISGEAFKSDFATAMIKMGGISPLTGSKGQIRKNCRRVN